MDKEEILISLVLSDNLYKLDNSILLWIWLKISTLKITTSTYTKLPRFSKNSTDIKN